MASTPSTTVATRAPRAAARARAPSPVAHHVHPQVVRQRRGARQRQPGHHGEDGGEGHRGDEAQEGVPPTTSASSGAAMLPPLSTALMASRPTSTDGAEAEDEREQVEEADEPGGVEHRAARRPRVGHGVEAHEDVRQPRGAEHQRQAQRDRVQRIGHELARARARRRRTASAAACEQRQRVEAEAREHQQRQQRRARRAAAPP